MKRDPRLRGLSTEHHHALVFARALSRHPSPWTEEDGVMLRRRFASELEPHFCTEEVVLLPALRLVGAEILVERTLEDHDFLRRYAAAAADAKAVQAFAARLHDHVRFEERELFPVCEVLGDDVLAEVLRRSPKRR